MNTKRDSCLNPEDMQRYKIAIQYRGTNFAGYQMQTDAQGRVLRTVQGTLEDALGALLPGSGRVETYVSGRTDSGVHAKINFVHANLRRVQRKTGAQLPPFTALEVKKSLNATLRKQCTDLVVPYVEAVNENFHARFSAIERVYEYKLTARSDSSPFGLPFESDLRWYYKGNIDVKKMRDAAQVFVGLHDFTAFCGKGQQDSNVRTINSITIIEEPVDPLLEGRVINLTIRFAAKAFLWHQVRKLVGALVAVGSGKRTKEDLVHVMERRDPSIAPPMAPPQGLYLTDVKFVAHEILDSSEPRRIIEL